MNNLSIPAKLWILICLLLGIIVSISFVGYLGLSETSGYIHGLSKTQVPAVRAMTLTDMMHDGIKANVYESLHTALKNDSEGMVEVLKSTDELHGNIAEYIATLEKLDLSRATKEKIAPSIPAIENYKKIGREIVTFASKGKLVEAEALLPDFLKSFDDLEELLGSLGDAIEKDAESFGVEAQTGADKDKMTTLVVSSAGLIIGLALAFLIINGLIQVLSSTVESIMDASRKVKSASSDAMSSAHSLSRSTHEQASGLQETIASAEEISAMVTQNSESAAKAKDTVEMNRVAAAEGAKTAQQMMDAISEIRSSNENIVEVMEQSNKEFAQIVQIISEIGEKTKVINDIVFQTKLLSFNASVEAARAGEHGKGFAVVAEEVGNLARMSGNAAKEITDMLSASIKTVNTIVEDTKSKVEDIVEVGKDKVALGQSTAERCRETLKKVAENATTVANMITEVATASKEQAQGVNEINSAITQLDKVTQQNTVIAEQSSVNASVLTEQSDSLNHLIVKLTSMMGREAVRDQSEIRLQTDSVLASKGAGSSLESDSSKNSGRVVVLKQKGTMHNLVSKPKDKIHRNDQVKVASGSDISPSNEDSGFENF